MIAFAAFGLMLFGVLLAICAAFALGVTLTGANAPEILIAVIAICLVAAVFMGLIGASVHAAAALPSPVWMRH